MEAIALALTLVAMSAACGGGGSSGPPPPPPPVVSVTVAPLAQNVLLGAQQQFTATVTNATSTAVTWSVNGITGGNSTIGTIDVNGLYRGPAILPSPVAVTVRATSVPSPGSSGTATATVTSDVVVSITAPTQNANVEVGAAQQILSSIASTGNGANQSVTWSVSGVGCVGAACGTINAASGMFTAPSILPTTNPTRDVTVTAVSVADPSKSATLTLRIAANFTFAINSPTGNTINNALTFQFVAIFTPVPGSNPNTAVTWSVSGPVGGCVGTACGTIDQAGLYTAPNLAPSPPQVAISAISVADSSKGQTSPQITINTIVLVAILPASLSIEIEAQQTFTANVGGTANRNVTWDISGPGCTNAGNCGSLSVITGQMVVDTFPVIYTAPTSIPSGGIGPITITATSVQDTTKSASTTPTFFSSIQATLLPSGSTRAVNHRQTLDAVLVRTSTGTLPVASAVDWTVIDNANNRFAGGNTTVGQICVKAPDGSPCTQTSVTQAGPPGVPFQVDYLAPTPPPTGGAVTIEMRSQADPSKFITAAVTVAANVTVNISPGVSTLPTSGNQQFIANVVGAANQNVTWSVSGAGCSGAACGSINSSGLYTSPASVPLNTTPSDTVTATSVDSPAQSGIGTVTIRTGAFISKISPASITALGAGSTDFVIKVQGLNFAAGASGSGGSTIVLGTVPPTSLSTACSTIVCTATITAASVTSPGDYGVQVVNPPASQFPGASNQVALKVLDAVTQVRDYASAPVVTLTAVNPDATGHDILVVEPTTAGSLLEHYNMNLIGVVVGTSCNLQGTGVTLTRPASGVQNIDICVENSNTGPSLSATDTFTISGPSPNDITIVQKQAFGGNGFIIQITLQIGSTSQLGARTLFAENKNREKTALVGGIEVK